MVIGPDAPADPGTQVAKENTPPKPPPPDPLKEMQEAEEHRIAHEQELAKLSADRDAAAAAVAQREKDLLAFKNPYLARPKLSTTDAEKIEGMGGEARANWAQDQIDAAKAAEEAAQKALDDANAAPPN